jgi:aminoglycoside 6-adenylyltransferase
MRSEQQMFDLILDTARMDERIRAVILNGSRANPNAPRDCFRDYDIVYLVSELTSFLADPTWIDRFGERMILQTPEAMGDTLPREDSAFTYLMQFMDGNRIDLSLVPLAKLNLILDDSLSVLLLDKDGRVPSFPPASEASYLPKPPTEKAFNDCCNEFWWVSPYVAKGLWRQELPYARHMLDEVVREQLMKMLTWHIGIQTGFALNSGKNGKYFKRHLETHLWQLLLDTYADGSYENTWRALFRMAELFRQVAQTVAQHFAYSYPAEDDRKVSAYLKHIQALPIDATEQLS